MNNQKVVYECTALMGINKTGTLKPNADGYYTVVLGALDYYNSRGQWYDLQDSKHLFEASSSFMRRIQAGSLFGEWGHPRPYGMSGREFVARVEDLYEPNICQHTRKVWLEPHRDPETGRQYTRIMGEIKPAGPKGEELRKMFETPGLNVCFSIRSFTEDRMVGGVLKKGLRKIVGWDYVCEPGIATANKWSCPTLESFTLTVDDLKAARDTLANSGVSMESANHIQETIDAYVRPRSALPASARIVK